MPATILSFAIDFALFALCIALLLTVFRILRGPTLADRVVALDMLVAVSLGFTAVFALRSGFSLFIDIAVVLGLVGFLTTVAFARYMMTQQPPSGDTRPGGPAATKGSKQRRTNPANRRTRGRR